MEVVGKNISQDEDRSTRRERAVGFRQTRRDRGMEAGWVGGFFAGWWRSIESQRWAGRWEGPNCGDLDVKPEMTEGQSSESVLPEGARPSARALMTGQG